MPIYEYYCNRCDRDFELLVRSTTRIECPDCSNAELTRKISTFSVNSGKQAEPAELCGTCGMTPGSCGFDG